MQKRLKYNIAKIYNQLGYDEQTSYLYLNIANGLKTVKGDLNNPIGEQIYHTGDIAKYEYCYLVRKNIQYKNYY